MLEWTTAEEAEKNAKEDIACFAREMWINVLVGIILLIFAISNFNILTLVISICWIISPAICCFISKKIERVKPYDWLNNNEKQEVIELAKKTWQFFEDYINEENNYLPPDNYQEERNNLIVDRTSSTNIGLGIMAIISAYDL